MSGHGDAMAMDAGPPVPPGVDPAVPSPLNDDAPPGVCYVGEWGAEVPALADSDGSRVMYCGVGRRP